jgi:hypothetical protein
MLQNWLRLVWVNKLDNQALGSLKKNLLEQNRYGLIIDQPKKNPEQASCRESGC